jgi:hypothetical protein
MFMLLEEVAVQDPIAADTVKSPEVAVFEKSTVTALPVPLIVLPRPLYDQLYVTPPSDGTAYATPVWPCVTLEEPEVKAAGCEGRGLTVIPIVLAALAPQELETVTLRFPEVAEALKSTVTAFPEPLIVAPEPVVYVQANVPVVEGTE